LPKELQQEIYRYKVLENNRNRERKRNFVQPLFLLEILLISIHPFPGAKYEFTIR